MLLRPGKGNTAIRGDPMETEIRKNATETIRVERTEYQGKDLVDVRVWVEGVAGGEAKPTKKELCLRPETWRELLPAIREALPLDGARGGEPVEPPEEPDNDQAGGAD